jgi:UV DNA damage endonuclease
MGCRPARILIPGAPVLRFGLCCIFVEAPIKFRQTTAKNLLRLPRPERAAYISRLCLENAGSLVEAIKTVRALGIGAFRVLSPLLPRYTHPEAGYRLDDLPDAAAIVAHLNEVNRLRRQWDIRLSFHPDQFVLLSSPDAAVTARSVAELDYQAMLAELIGADTITIHGGGAYGDKAAALKRLRRNFARLPERVKNRLALENDDVSYTVAELLPVCADLHIPLVYDIHHHRCLHDALNIAGATAKCLETWERTGRGEPYLHLSSPWHGWAGGSPRAHAELIDFDDLPREWLGLRATVDIEAKGKERAVLKLMREVENFCRQ